MADSRRTVDEESAALLHEPDEPDPHDRPECADIGPVDEAVATVAVCLRWGSYLAVLLDRAKPLCSAADEEGVARCPERSATTVSGRSVSRYDVPVTAYEASSVAQATVPC